MYQQFIAVGNLTRDPEMRYTPAGVPVASFDVAINKSWVSAEGQKQEKVLFVRVTAWRKLAETVAQYLTKGRQVMVVGEIEEARGYLNNAGEVRASLEVTAQTVRFLGQREGGDSAGNNASVDNVSVENSQDIPF